jgi:hypothetical protein
VCVCVWGGSGGFLCKVQRLVLTIVMFEFFFFSLFWFLVHLFYID